MGNEQNLRSHSLGWIGAGRMGFAMAKRLLDSGCDVTVYNRTRATNLIVEAPRIGHVTGPKMTN